MTAGPPRGGETRPPRVRGPREISERSVRQLFGGWAGLISTRLTWAFSG